MEKIFRFDTISYTQQQQQQQQRCIHPEQENGAVGIKHERRGRGRVRVCFTHTKNITSHFSMETVGAGGAMKKKLLIILNLEMSAADILMFSPFFSLQVMCGTSLNMIRLSTAAERRAEKSAAMPNGKLVCCKHIKRFWLYKKLSLDKYDCPFSANGQQRNANESC